MVSHQPPQSYKPFDFLDESTYKHNIQQAEQQQQPKQQQQNQQQEFLRKIKNFSPQLSQDKTNPAIKQEFVNQLNQKFLGPKSET